MTLTTDLAYTSAAELAARVKRRELSPVEIVDACIEHIEARNPSLNAFVYLGFDDARQRARAAELAVIAGQQLGPLHGVPSAMKDLFDFKPGWKSTFGGIPALKDMVVDLTCVYAERIKRAGAILVGKTNGPVMGFRGTCDNYLFGPTRNPFNVARNSGGSSGGSASAVADGLVPIAEGTDGGGSIRIPSAWCGVYGFKASFGRIPYVSRPNAFSGDVPYLFEGTITRTVEDAAIGISALTGYHPGRSAEPRAQCRFHHRARSIHTRHDASRTARTSTCSRSTPKSRASWPAQSESSSDTGAEVEEVKVGITRSQRELSDLWCRLIIGGQPDDPGIFQAPGDRSAAGPSRRPAARVLALGGHWLPDEPARLY